MSRGTNQKNDDLMIMDPALKIATVEFEKRFKIVVEFSPTQRSPSHAPPPCDKRYTSYFNGLPKAEGELPVSEACPTAEQAVAQFSAFMMALNIGDAKTLYWRKRPALEGNRQRKNRRWFVYCRLAFA